MSHRSLQVLLVEDNPDDVFFLERALEKSGLGWSLRVVTDGQEALDYLSGSKTFADRAQHPLPDLILLDLKLPYVSGFEVLGWIREQPGLRGLPVVILTSSPEERDQRRAAELGVRAYLLKPPNETMLRAIAEHMQGVWPSDSRPMMHFTP